MLTTIPKGDITTIRRFIFLYFCCVFASLAYAVDTPKIFTKDNVLAAGCYNDGYSEKSYVSD